MIIRDKQRTMKASGGKITTSWLGPNATGATVEVNSELDGASAVWLTPQRMRLLAKRLLWIANQIEGQR